MNKKEKPTIAMLLDTEHLYGISESRMGPLVTSLLIGGAPILLYVYFGLFMYIPVWLFIIFEVLFAIRVIMKIQGREGYRMQMFKRTLYDQYSEAASIMNIKTIHPDGCIEFNNGTILYLVASFNGTCEDEIARSIELRKFLTSMLGDYVADIYIQNVVMSDELRKYYDKVSKFGRNESAKNFIKIIDYTLSLTEDTSLVQCTIYALRGRRSDWKEMQHQLNTACKSITAKVYKTVYRVSDPDEINYILNTDIGTVISIGELLRNKYMTKDYGTSKVLAYDLDNSKVIEQGRSAVKPVLPEQTAAGFHVVYEEES